MIGRLRLRKHGRHHPVREETMQHLISAPTRKQTFNLGNQHIAWSLWVLFPFPMASYIYKQTPHHGFLQKAKAAKICQTL